MDHPNQNVGRIDIFNYFDYRDYLSAAFLYFKKSRIGFSHRVFAREAGISSPNYLLRVMQKKRNLTLEYLPFFCKALRLTSEEAEYLKVLVCFNNEKDSRKKEQYVRNLLTLRCSRGEYKLQDTKLLFFSRWYYPLIRELAVISDFRDDYNFLARTCVPRITAIQAKNAVKYLLTNGFIRKSGDGAYSYADPTITTGAEVNSTILRNYHRRTILQSAEALDTIGVEDRDISSLTMSVSRETYKQMKKELQDFRKRLLAMARDDKNGEMVCYAGFQLLPKSKTIGKNKNSELP